MEKKNLASSIWCLQEEAQYKDKDKLKVKRWEKVYCTTTNQKKAGVAILITDKTFSKNKGNYQKQMYQIITKGYQIKKESILPEDIRILNICI